MENKMQIFENEMFGSIRTLVDGEKVLFCGSDVAKALGYAKPQNAIAAHCKGALKRGILTNGGEQEMSFIHEGDLYRLIVHSKLPSAEKFERWVFDDVLPPIRKTGGYVNNSELFVNTYFPALYTDQKVLIHGLLENGMRQQAIIAEMKPKAEFAEMVQASEGTLSMAEYSKLLYDKESIKIGRNKLCKLFRDNSVFCQDNKPRQEYVERAYFRVVETIKNGQARTSSRITGRGQIWATKKIKEWLA